MNNRKLDVSTGAGGAVTVARVAFDTHLGDCAGCQPNLCFRAEALWRDVCLTALRRDYARQQSNALADTVTAAPVAAQHPATAAVQESLTRRAEPDWDALYPSTQQTHAEGGA